MYLPTWHTKIGAFRVGIRILGFGGQNLKIKIKLMG
jgi:hypothetical protein